LFPRRLRKTLRRHSLRLRLRRLFPGLPYRLYRCRLPS